MFTVTYHRFSKRANIWLVSDMKHWDVNMAVDFVYNHEYKKGCSTWMNIEGYKAGDYVYNDEYKMFYVNEV